MKTCLRLLILLSWQVCAAPAMAEDPSLGPVIEGYGPTFAIEDRDVALPDNTAYRVVFDAADYAGAPAGLNSELVSVARFLNMHARNGVEPRKMDIAVVLHGEALKSALSGEAYQARFGSGNPNLDLLTRLHAAGVSFYACGQSMGFRGIGGDELASAVKVALSAMTMLALLQSDGYALLP
jgi:intracellular sulfur oxidation DsrE/DsrF family protein